MFDENFLLTVASIAAFAIKDYTEAVAVMIFYGIGELLQDLAAEKSKKNIIGLMDLRSDYANLKSVDKILTVHPAEVKMGQIIVIRPGEKIPLDGIVISGESYIDTKAITGESVPKSVMPGMEVLSGTINQGGLLEIEVTKEFGESTVSKILELIKHAESKKSKSEKFITRFARKYTPIVVAIAVLVAILPPVLKFGTFNEWIYRAISFLIISCPCALVISIPVGIFGGIGGSARNGILIKGGNYLDELTKIDTLVFDKTGTLTKGVFEVTEVKPVDMTADKLIEYAAIAEQSSNHPIAKSILSYYNKAIKIKAGITEKAGMGVIAKTKNETIYAGNEKLMKEIGIDNLPELEFTTVYIAVDKKYVGYILISDAIKENAGLVLSKLKSRGINKIVMLTGDNYKIARALSQKLNIDEFYADLLPQEKFEKLELIKQQSKGRVAFVGDGINDAPALRSADIGIAMGGIGSDAAVESADIVLMNDDLSKIADAKAIALKTKKIVNQNIFMSLFVKFTVMALAFLGKTSIWFAIMADVGVALLAILNATRTLKLKNISKQKQIQN